MTENNETAATEISQLSYEEARAELVETVRKLDSRDIPLEDALKLWERGQELAAHCQAILASARERVAAKDQSGAGSEPEA
ncbi:exodeoxyribonuclease VII small subunit [Boudabousia marimammalium]|uniref:Exodeoxyribonuclease 7 small subunit n=1 Tax=Boudabousia marimammalium TaxID=156892 RepID=A0A1Q5PRR1_9ACTO|nr:exodeoxyribonuclease VII small subunit [Boudabousia marimammalium]OKL50261.1 exodeoxyribonuclease VII small subunit [Boudabousia marimammalium]